MGKKQSREDGGSSFDQARDELYSHILRCGVLEADEEHQRAWFDDTIEYMAERYAMLTEKEIARLRALGERYCRPVIRHGSEVAASKD